jgi:hypothetical protein
MAYAYQMRALVLSVLLLGQIGIFAALAFTNQSPKKTRLLTKQPTEKTINHEWILFASKEIDSNDDLLNALEESDSSDSLASFRESASSNISSLLSSFSDVDSSSSTEMVTGDGENKEDETLSSSAFIDNFEWDVYICQSKQCKGMSRVIFFQSKTPWFRLSHFIFVIHDIKPYILYSFGSICNVGQFQGNESIYSSDSSCLLDKNKSQRTEHSMYTTCASLQSL